MYLCFLGAKNVRACIIVYSIRADDRRLPKGKEKRGCCIGEESRDRPRRSDLVDLCLCVRLWGERERE